VSTPVSVVIPVYNKGRFVEAAIRSALEQVPAPFEIVVVDDGSTDDSRERILSISDPRVRLVSTAQPRSGPSNARNTGILQARSDWVSFLDADDEWLPGYLSAVGDMISTASDDVDCAFTGWAIMARDGSYRQNPFSKRMTGPGQLDFAGFLRAWLADRYCPIWTSAVTFRRHALIERGMFPVEHRRGEDKETWVRVLAGRKALYDPRALAQYNLHTENQLTSENTNRRHPLCVAIPKLLDHVSAEERLLLMRLSNHEIKLYARYAGQRTRVSREVFRGYYVGLDPIGYAQVVAMHLTPPFIQRRLKALLRM
jgi:glycosyltransferase involved in cell wall biosynthesis